MVRTSNLRWLQRSAFMLASDAYAMSISRGKRIRLHVRSEDLAAFKSPRLRSFPRRLIGRDRA